MADRTRTRIPPAAPPHSTTACHRASLPHTPSSPSPLASAPRPPAACDLACRSPPRTHTGIMAFALPPLPYAYDALEPYIDSTTVRLGGRPWGLGLGCCVATSAAGGGLLWCLRMLVPVRGFVLGDLAQVRVFMWCHETDTCGWLLGSLLGCLSHCLWPLSWCASVICLALSTRLLCCDFVVADEHPPRT